MAAEFDTIAAESNTRLEKETKGGTIDTPAFESILGEVLGRVIPAAVRPMNAESVAGDDRLELAATAYAWGLKNSDGATGALLRGDLCVPNTFVRTVTDSQLAVGLLTSGLAHALGDKVSLAASRTAPSATPAQEPARAPVAVGVGEVVAAASVADQPMPPAADGPVTNAPPPPDPSTPAPTAGAPAAPPACAADQPAALAADGPVVAAPPADAPAPAPAVAAGETSLDALDRLLAALPTGTPPAESVAAAAKQVDVVDLRGALFDTFRDLYDAAPVPEKDTQPDTENGRQTDTSALLELLLLWSNAVGLGDADSTTLKMLRDMIRAGDPDAFLNTHSLASYANFDSPAELKGQVAGWPAQVKDAVQCRDIGGARCRDVGGTAHVYRIPVCERLSSGMRRISLEQ